MNKTVEHLNLKHYYSLFPEALRARYDGDDFEAGFSSIRERYADIESGKRLLAADDVAAIFDRSLPFHFDWTRPDPTDLTERMTEFRVGELVADLRGSDDIKLVGRIVHAFRELGLTALVLHHVYPRRYCMCSHHIASLLYITGHKKAATVPGFYVQYCKELGQWGKRFELTVAETEFALWTWYRLAHYGGKRERAVHQDAFERDEWLRKQRARRIADTLSLASHLDVARFFLDRDEDPTLSTMIAWREFEVAARQFLADRGVSRAHDADFRMKSVFQAILNSNRIGTGTAVSGTPGSDGETG